MNQHSTQLYYVLASFKLQELKSLFQISILLIVLPQETPFLARDQSFASSQEGLRKRRSWMYGKMHVRLQLLQLVNIGEREAFWPSNPTGLTTPCGYEKRFKLVMASGFVGVRTLPSIYGKQKTSALSSSKPLTTLKGLFDKPTFKLSTLNFVV